MCSKWALSVLSVVAASAAAALQPDYDEYTQALEAKVVALQGENNLLREQNTALQAKLPAGTSSATTGTCDIADFLPLEEHITELERGLDLASGVKSRLAEMNRTGISRMLVSLVGGPVDFNYSLPLEIATTYLRSRNEFLAEAVKLSGGRFKGLCNVYMVSPELAIPELQWCKSQGMLGILVHGNQHAILPDGSILVDYYYKNHSIAIWQEVARLGMIVYLHPTVLYASVPGLYQAHTITDVSGFTEHVAAYDSRDITQGCPYLFDQSSAYGFAGSAAQVVTHMIIEGVFDKVPDLKMVIGHNGESLPFLLWRIDHRLAGFFGVGCKAGDEGQRAHDFNYYFSKNIYVTTSGEFETPGLQYLMSRLPATNILFSMDSTIENITSSVAWFRGVADDQPEKCEALQKIAYRNAEALLNWSS